MRAGPEMQSEKSDMSARPVLKRRISYLSGWPSLAGVQRVSRRSEVAGIGRSWSTKRGPHPEPVEGRDPDCKGRRLIPQRLSVVAVAVEDELVLDLAHAADGARFEAG